MPFPSIFQYSCSNACVYSLNKFRFLVKVSFIRLAGAHIHLVIKGLTWLCSTFRWCKSFLCWSGETVC